MKNRKLNLIVIFLITIFMLWYVLKDNFNEVMLVLGEARFGWLLMAILFYLLYFYFDVLANHYVIRTYKKDIKLKFTSYICLINKFFSGITPLSSGGQPMQVYEMHKHGIAVSNGMNIVVQSYMMFQVALVFFGIVAVGFNQALHYFDYLPGLEQMFWIGFVINLVILIFLLFVSFSKNFNRIVVTGLINFLAALNIIKDREKQLRKWRATCRNYYENAQLLLKNRDVLFKGVGFQLLALAAFFVLPYFIALSLGAAQNLDLLKTITASAYVYLLGCYVPIPGASGGMEFGFLGYFGAFVTNGALNALMLLWRLITYYLPMIIGGIIFNVVSGKKAYAAAEKLAAEEKSSEH